jgi:hypothetical protein
MKTIIAILLLCCSGVRAGVFDVEWEPSEGAVRYMVYWRKAGAVNWIRHGYTDATSYAWLL